MPGFQEGLTSVCSSANLAVTASEAKYLRRRSASSGCGFLGELADFDVLGGATNARNVWLIVRPVC
jgi:hypothetical protein